MFSSFKWEDCSQISQKRRKSHSISPCRQTLGLEKNDITIIFFRLVIEFTCGWFHSPPRPYKVHTEVGGANIKATMLHLFKIHQVALTTQTHHCTSQKPLCFPKDHENSNQCPHAEISCKSPCPGTWRAQRSTQSPLSLISALLLREAVKIDSLCLLKSVG